MKINFEDLPLGFTWLPAHGVAMKIKHPANVVVMDDFGFDYLKDVGISHFILWENRSRLLPKEFI